MTEAPADAVASRLKHSAALPLGLTFEARYGTSYAVASLVAVDRPATTTSSIIVDLDIDVVFEIPASLPAIYHAPA